MVNIQHIMIMFSEMKFHRFISTISFISIFVLGCNCECPNTIPVWEAIPEDQYDRNATSVKPGMRPLGFYYTILPYTPDGDPNPCFTVEGTADKRVEIMAETHGLLNSKLCVRTQVQDFGCDDGRLYNCEQANANTLTIEFYCDTNGCDQSPIAIWVRFVVSFDEYDDDPEMFCMERDTGEYPSSLIKLPTEPPPNPIIPTTASGNTLTTSVTLLLATCFISILFKFEV
ncbi:uncharacterized protein [Amphiura filiformis]|uniref:uncharacterized protein n=1 Tax=Amphiura filiformis TaxID=82378 RepID=UPI003B225A6B